MLLRKAADRAGLTAGLVAALRKAGTSPVLDRGILLVSMAAAIALGATSMSDIAVLAHLAPVLGAAPSGPTVRRALDLAGTRPRRQGTAGRRGPRDLTGTARPERAAHGEPPRCCRAIRLNHPGMAYRTAPRGATSTVATPLA